MTEIRTKRVETSKQKLFKELEERIKKHEISEKELGDFLTKKTKKCYACGRKIEVDMNINQPEIINLEIHSDKIIAHLNNGQKSKVPINWFAKWGVENVTAEKLKKYEIWRGRNIYFSEVNEVLGIEKFLKGFDAPCE